MWVLRRHYLINSFLNTPIASRAFHHQKFGHLIEYPSPKLPSLPLLSSPRRGFLSAVSLNHGNEVIAVEDTIYALSTATGKAGIAVIRISGPACVEVYKALCPNKRLPQPRFASIRTLYEPLEQPRRNESILDTNALVLYFPSPKSVTGEDVLELHVHGGTAIVKAVLKAISNCPSSTGKIRYAEPGEYTRRAFLNDRLDLTQAEALGDSLSAVTEQQRKQSLRGSSGKLAKQYEDWRQRLLHARGELEALIDFSEDQHFDESPGELVSSVAKQIRELRRLISIHIENAARGELLRNGIDVALLGRPNTGKSSLLNLIVGREAAIVSNEAGTTRDVVEVNVDLGGYLCRFSDTAGLGSGDLVKGLLPPEQHRLVGAVEREGINRAKQRAFDSDVVIALFSVEHDPQFPDRGMLHIDKEVMETAARSAENGARLLFVINKMDLSRDGDDNHYGEAQLRSAINESNSMRKTQLLESQILGISCKDAVDASAPTHGNSGIKPLLKVLEMTFESITTPTDISNDPNWSDPALPRLCLANDSVWQESLGASERQRLLLQECDKHLDAFLTRAYSDVIRSDDVDVVIAAEILRSAADCLARITGRGAAGDVEEILGLVFEKCVSLDSV